MSRWIVSAVGELYDPDTLRRVGYYDLQGREIMLDTNVVGAGTTEAIAMAAADRIPRTAQSFRSEYRATPGDDGGARYRRVTAAQLAAYGMATMTLAMVAFPDGTSGDYWMLDEPEPHVAMVGAFGAPIGADPSPTSENDQAVKIMALLEYLRAVHGGGVARYGYRLYYCHSDLVMPIATGLQGPANQGRDAVGSIYDEAVAGVLSQPALVMRSGVASLRYQDEPFLQDVTVRRHGITAHTDLAGALDAQIAFTGYGVQKVAGGGSARGANVRNLNLLGFAYGADFYKTPGIRASNIYGDALCLIQMRSSGQTAYVDECKRKSMLTANASIQWQGVAATALFNSGGYVGVTLASDVTALGGSSLTTGQVVGNQGMPSAFASVRRAVTVLSATSIRLEGQVWDAAYSSADMSEASIAWQPGCSSAVTSLYNAGGKVGVLTSISMPFQPNHQLILEAPGNAAHVWTSVQTRVSATEFVLAVDWNSGLGSIDLSTVFLTAMPGVRAMPDTNNLWGTREGFAFVIDDCDDIYFSGSNKGGAGIWINGTGRFVFSGENGAVGELDQRVPDFRGVVTMRPRTEVAANSKSVGTGVHVNMSRANHRQLLRGCEATDGGTAALRQDYGSLTNIEMAVRGVVAIPRTIVNNITDQLNINGGLRPEGLSTATSSVASIRRTHWMHADGEQRRDVSTSYRLQGWTSGGALADVLTASVDGVRLYAPFTSYPLVYRVSVGALALTNAQHGAHIMLDGTGNGISLDASAVVDGFMVTIVNLRGANWSWPAFTGGTVQLIGSYAGTPTKVLNNGEMVLRVRADGGGNRKILLRGDLTT